MTRFLLDIDCFRQVGRRDCRQLKFADHCIECVPEDSWRGKLFRAETRA